ncbi:adenine nucleotide alpha hydrolases-like protein [Parathielavia appendiculata]|uniref:Diphthine--ammonia ligase n=1 Tax=Parathielavia appendiculata TaxID=2587402 RepID=A0AAN6Z8P6_9PEZI|nr:adenine nucleotide alpha hydrolases-like protein [Parathielavia appendiculata]
MSNTPPGGLNVIALVSGGKDSFFSLLHCRANGHRIVALANLHPALPGKPGPPNDTSASPAVTIPAVTIPAVAASAAVSAPALKSTPASWRPRQSSDQDGPYAAILPDHDGGAPGNEVVSGTDEDEHDLNSFMYQTVGHQVIPLYAEATGIPLYRRAITGGATQSGKEYSHYRPSATPEPGLDSGSDEHRGRWTHELMRFKSRGEGEGRPGSDHHGQESENHVTTTARSASAGQEDTGVAADEDNTDETESMVPLLQAIMKAHPEANAICAGAILSTYQRTRVESVATRLGLTPLAYLWKFPVLPAPSSSSSSSDPTVGSLGSDAQLLDDLAAAGVEARIIKVASGGLDDSFLWADVAAPGTKGSLARAMRRFGAAETGAVVGEGGEFETLVLDGPSTLFRKRIVVDELDRRVVREGGGSAWLSLRNARLEEKGLEAGEEGIDKESVRIPDLLDPRFVGVLNTLSSPEADGFSLFVQSGLGEMPRLGNLRVSTSEKAQQWCFVGSKSGSIEVDTRTVVEQIRRRLRQHSLPPSAIITATVVLRRMADFPAVNSIYCTLFDAPNPPSRVTISCGDALSTVLADADMAVYLTVHTALQPGQRHGLHVQSRSYWAPANIGPYSQAMSIPVSSLGPPPNDSDTPTSSSTIAPRLVSIAGQIPLVPATMALPPPGSSSSHEDTLALQLVLSLQHLWRIGIEMGVQWWTSAVAFFPVAACDRDGGQQQVAMEVKARMAARAWRAAHASGSTSAAADDGEEDEDEEEEGGPDLWDKRYNPAYMTFSSSSSGGAGDNKNAGPSLPDRSVLSVFSSPSSLSRPTAGFSCKSMVPPVFVAEVEELPRGAGVEWHALWGVAHAAEGSVVLGEVCLPREGDGQSEKIMVSQVVVRSGEERGVGFVQTVVAEGFGGDGWKGVDGSDDAPPTTTTSSSGTKRGFETSLQRHQRLKREAEARARPKSKAELAAEADARREAALSQSLFTTQPKSKGLAMMARMGFTGGALGKKKSTESEPSSLSSSSTPAAPPTEGGPANNDGGTTSETGGGATGARPRTEPIRIEIKDGREGIGLESERKRKLREAAEAAGERAKRARAEEGEYRERMRREREEARLEKLVVAGQKVAEKMAGDREGEDAVVVAVAARPLKGIPVVFRGFVKAREEAERDRRMRYDLEQGLARLPTYEDAEEDEDDKKALGKASTTYVTAEDLDEEDPELDEFNALPPDERLRRVVQHLRDEYHYCFWCKFTYPDEKMDGCPGLTEEDHD